jgi:predicted amidophosphoribosyltransferase
MSGYDPRLLDTLCDVVDEELSDARQRIVAQVMSRLGILPGEVKLCSSCGAAPVGESTEVCPDCSLKLANEYHLDQHRNWIK